MSKQNTIIGQNIATIRKHWQLSQEKLSQLIHSSRGMVLHYESGRTTPDDVVLSSLATLSGIPAHTLTTTLINPSHIKPLPLTDQLTLTAAPLIKPNLFPLGIPSAVPFLSMAHIQDYLHALPNKSAHTKFIRSLPTYPILTTHLQHAHIVIQNPLHTLTTTGTNSILMGDNLLCIEATPAHLQPGFPYLIFTPTNLIAEIYSTTTAKTITTHTTAGHITRHPLITILKIYQPISILSRPITPYNI